MAESSIFKGLLEQFMPMLGLYVTEKVNGQNATKPLSYLHKQRLRMVYSADQKWEGTSANTRYVAADYVSMDSGAPLKRRGSIQSSNGKLPKMSISRKMEESDINTINIMMNQLDAIEVKQGADSEAYKQKKRQILKKLIDDPTFCSIGLDERNEMSYLDGISNGIVLVEDENNVGLGLRVNYGYKAANILRTAVLDECNGDDFQRVVDKVNSDGNSIAVAMVSKSRLDKIRRTRWARELTADYREQVYTDNSTLPVPSQKTFLEAFESEYGFGFIVVDRTIRVEKNGNEKPIKPFNQDRIIFLPNADYDGSLVYGTLAEMTNPAEYVNYSTVDEFKLISRLRITEPSLVELTKGQALVLPVIEDVDGIYVLDFSKAVELDESDATDTGAVDAKITIEGKVYKKEAVITALKTFGISVKSNYTDATIIKKVNELSDEDFASFLDAIKDELYTASSD